ncbi:S-layer protein [uncultured archaeon]|nr:S-layer protein [uncultured archaeon]
MTNKVSNYGKITIILSIIVIVLIGGCVKESENKIPEKNIYYYSLPGFENDRNQSSILWEKINRSDEARYVTSERSYSAIVFVHPYTVGVFDPSSAEWIVMLSSIPEKEAEIKIAIFRFDYLTLDIKMSYEFSFPVGEELSLEQSIAVMEEEMKKDTYGSKSVERQKVIFQGGNYVYSYPAGDFGGTIIVNKYVGKAVFYATTVWNGKGKLIIPEEESAGIHLRIITPSPPGNTLSQAFNESSGIFIKYWNARNFLGFWGDSETNVSSETLVINQSLLNNSYRVIEKHNLIYTTVPVPVNFQVYRHTGNAPESTAGFYNAIGWLGEKYVLLDGNRIARIILEQNASDAKVMRIGESWGLGEGYRVVAQSIDSMVPEKQGWFVLYKDNNKLEDIIIGPKDVWSYRSKINDSIPTFVTYFQRIYPLPDADGADLKYIWLISTQAIEIKEGDIFGIMEVTSAKNGMIELKNKEPIDLAPGKKINLLGNITIEVENSTTDLVFYLNSTRWYQPLRTVMDTIYQDHPFLKDDISMREVGEDYYFRDYILKGLTYTISAYPKRGLNEERIIITLQDGVTERLKSIEIIPEKGEDIYPNIIAVGNFSGYENQTFVAINDWKEWEVVWQKHTRYLGDKKPIPPKINFSN